MYDMILCLKVDFLIVGETMCSTKVIYFYIISLVEIANFIIFYSIRSYKAGVHPTPTPTPAPTPAPTPTSTTSSPSQSKLYSLIISCYSFSLVYLILASISNTILSHDPVSRSKSSFGGLFKNLRRGNTTATQRAPTANLNNTAPNNSPPGPSFMNQRR